MWFRAELGGIPDEEGMVQLLHKLGREWGKVNDRFLIWSILRGKKFWLGRKKLEIQISQDLCFTGDYTGCNIDLLSETLTMPHCPFLVTPCTFLPAALPSGHRMIHVLLLLVLGKHYF